MRKLSILFLLAFFVLAGTVSAQEQTNETYTVQRGDTLTTIANTYDVDVDAILIANNIIDPNRISVGQVLVIPTVALTVPRTHVIQAGETLNDLAIRYNTTVEALVATNEIANPASLTIGQVLTLPAIGGPATFPRNYRVDIGDTLRSIGETYGVTWQNLAAYNNIANPNYVEAGTLIVIPPVGWQPSTATTDTTTTVQTSTPVVPVVSNVRYVVQAGDTLNAIAGSFSVTLESLREFNNLAVGEAIFAGDVLTIPPTGGTVVNETVVVTTRTAVNGVYTVQAGDTLFAIAADFGLNVYDLAEANNILNLNSIYSGQQLNVSGN